MAYSTFYAPLVDAWVASVETERVEINFALKNGVLQLLSFDDDGSYHLEDLATFLDEIALASDELIRSERASEAAED